MTGLSIIFFYTFFKPTAHIYSFFPKDVPLKNTPYSSTIFSRSKLFWFRVPQLIIFTDLTLDSK